MEAEEYYTAYVNASPRYAGFLVRFIACLFDSVLFTVICWPIALILKDYLGPLVIIVIAALAWAYNAGFESSSYMGTPGKIACSLKVAGSNGERISLEKASLRFSIKLLVPSLLAYFSVSYLGGFFLLGDSMFIIIDKRNQSLHDMIADTVVYQTRNRII